MNVSRSALRAVGVASCVVSAAAQGFGPPAGNPGDAFGYAVAADGPWLAVGAPQFDLGASSTGRVWLREEDAMGVPQWSSLDPPDPGADGRFGRVLDLDGRNLAVLEPRGGGQAARVHLYDLQPTVRRVAELRGGSGAPDGFGEALALDGDWLAVGARLDDGAGSDCGAVHLYQRGATGWSAAQVLRPTGLDPYDFFGCAVDLDGDQLLVGAWADDDAGPQAGAAYRYERVGTQWVLRDKWVDPSGAAHDHAGASVALCGNLAALGVPGSDDAGLDAGAVLVFEGTSGTWAPVQRLSAPALGPGAALGNGVDVHPEGLLVAGAPLSDSAGNNVGGYVAWRRSSSGFEILGPHHGAAPGGGPLPSGAYLGLDLDLGPDTVFVGAFGAGASGVPTGLVVSQPLVELSGGGAVPVCVCTSGPCGNDDLGKGCGNSTGGGASLARSGSTSLALDDLTLVVEDLPAGALVLLTAGQPVGATPFFDGTRCVSVTTRVPLLVGPADPSGRLIGGPGLVGSSLGAAALPGRTTAVQAWYRDLSGPCGSGANASNALLLTWVP